MLMKNPGLITQISDCFFLCKAHKLIKTDGVFVLFIGEYFCFIGGKALGGIGREMLVKLRFTPRLVTRE